METINFLHCVCCYTFPVYRKFKEETYHVHCLKLTQGTLLYSWIVWIYLYIKLESWLCSQNTGCIPHRTSISPPFAIYPWPPPLGRWAVPWQSQLSSWIRPDSSKTLLVCGAIQFWWILWQPSQYIDQLKIVKAIERSTNYIDNLKRIINIHAGGVIILRLIILSVYIGSNLKIKTPHHFEKQKRLHLLSDLMISRRTPFLQTFNQGNLQNFTLGAPFFVFGPRFLVDVRLTCRFNLAQPAKPHSKSIVTEHLGFWLWEAGNPKCKSIYGNMTQQKASKWNQHFFWVNHVYTAVYFNVTFTYIWIYVSLTARNSVAIRGHNGVIKGIFPIAFALAFAPIFGTWWGNARRFGLARWCRWLPVDMCLQFFNPFQCHCQ